MAARTIFRKVFVKPQAFSFSMISVDRKPITPCFAGEKVLDPVSASRRNSTNYKGDLVLWDKKVDMKQLKLLQKVLVEGSIILNRSILSLKPYRRSGKEGIKFTTTPSQTGIPSVRRLELQCPYELPRQVVEGVVCITTKDAFMLYNPTTGVKSPWIETAATQEVNEGKARRQVESIALGFDSRTRIHKVICISSYVKERSAAPETEEDRLLVVEVLNVQGRTWTTGAHKWRKVKAQGGPPTFSRGERFSFVDGPVYVNDQIHWQFRHGHSRKREKILGVHVGREDFSYIPIPARLKEDFMDPSRHLQSMLMEFDGKIAILKSTSDEKTSVWSCEILSKMDKDAWEIKWGEEKILIPYADVCQGSSIVALKGTDLILVQSHGYISYYNLKTGISTSRIPDHFESARIMEL